LKKIPPKELGIPFPIPKNEVPKLTSPVILRLQKKPDLTQLCPKMTHL